MSGEAQKQNSAFLESVSSFEDKIARSAPPMAGGSRGIQMAPVGKVQGLN